MVSLTSLWIPILLSTVIVFIASFLTHMVLRYHRTDYAKVPAEDKVLDSLRPFDLPPGDYFLPCGTGPESMKDPAFIDKMKRGPVIVMTVIPSGPPSMGKELVMWFIYCAVVGFFSAYIASRALGPGAHYLSVFRFIGAAAFIGYSLALWQNSIWYKRKWSTTIKSTLDGLVYALLTAGTFGWLWPDS